MGVGAQRCGTTWWWRLLCDHPQVHVAAGKETHFFDGYYASDFTTADVAAYHRLFRRPRGSLTGEWCPRYMHDFWVPGMLRMAAPDARILVMLRDPLRRYQSGLSHEVDVLKRDVRRKRVQYVGAMSANDAVSRSLYAQQIERLLEHFESEQILVLQYEKCVQDPAGELRRTFEFLGADPADHSPPVSLLSRSGRRHPQLEPTDLTGAAATRAIRRDAADLGALAPAIDLQLWPSCREGESESGR